MFHAIRLSALSLIVALLLSACQPIMAAAQSLPAAPAQPHGLRPDAPSYAIQGPYAVGVQDFEIEAADDTERPLTVTVWYPAVNSQGSAASDTYEMGFPAGDTPNFSVVGNAIEGAEPATVTGPTRHRSCPWPLHVPPGESLAGRTSGVAGLRRDLCRS